VLAEESNLDFFGLGEHHIGEMPLSAPDMVPAAVAARTSRIHLGSAVTVLSSDDPVRVFQRYATLDALSSGRAEVILGRGSSVESFQRTAAGSLPTWVGVGGNPASSCARRGTDSH
jgi:alkanesulfonate monooxygenase SsuD/methylene tetrahydromethanopterin reductase-like flavin-dependent oxidoreductase (luciferase family)